MKNGKKEIAPNTHLLLSTLLFAFFVLLSAFGIREQEIWTSIGFAVAACIPLFVFLISPMYYIFSEDGIEIVYLWGQKEDIKWTSIKSISFCGSWINRGGATPHYHIAYPSKKKRAFFVCGDVSKTNQTKKLLMKYYKNTIV